ncbi:DarT ssDNA thymidine ADP-ribosyltransferase family protein [Proteiniborus sp. MB09-C3]|uniref:DarT ssDNA thymidine ADP-ribosyltransferase family protein n=1 Tax=Proteiniborus sp. MB09-C3 TaxID=3050072 RepID=UPI002554C769|nr:DarT ssDNA thymidine ADP-ribosyltransferase family protein [Proteiniborus sp. MB09-C3]WIV12104.1 DarT ssDNA thymidine ADP-ribosyltransferase family protein [Proteiniborus sp. MB09-C3]
MTTYNEIINEQRERLNKNINWWPLYLYHFTDVHNAVSIIDREYILGRKQANEEKLMITDNASSQVIEITNEEVSKYARLYMRPKTPTQYHNEGYKPPHIRETNLNANCPVPVFFLLDAEKTLSMDGVKFIEKGLAGRAYNNENLLDGAENFAYLNFQKIFHDGPFSQGSDIKQYRHTEVVRENGIPISDIIRGIACRSIAEKQTLLYLLKKTSIKKYNKYKNIIMYKPETDLFFNNGIFIKNVKYEEGRFCFYLNDNSNRYNYVAANGEDIEFNVNVDWLGNDFEFLERTSGYTKLDYSDTIKLAYAPKTKVKSNLVLLEVSFDNCLMYLNTLKIDEFELV